jgi:uncharacterized membrane protein
MDIEGDKGTHKRYVYCGITLVILGIFLSYFGSIPSFFNIQGEILGLFFFIIGLGLIIVGGIIPNKKIIPKPSPMPHCEVIPKSSSMSQDEALNILMTRYAKGQITIGQFEQMKKELEKHS